MYCGWEVLKIFHLKIYNEKDFKYENGRAVISFEKSKKYALVFLEAIMKNHEKIYSYVQGFYRFIMNSNNKPFPEFKVSR